MPVTTPRQASTEVGLPSSRPEACHDKLCGKHDGNPDGGTLRGELKGPTVTSLLHAGAPDQASEPLRKTSFLVSLTVESPKAGQFFPNSTSIPRPQAVQSHGSPEERLGKLHSGLSGLSQCGEAGDLEWLCRNMPVQSLVYLGH